MFDQLMGGIEAQETERVAGILATGVDIERTQKSTRLTPLALAAKKGNLRIVDMLLAKGADVSNFSDDPDTVALILACANGHIDVVEKLLNHGADINVATCLDYETPLKAASRGGHAQLVKLLLDSGANRDFRSSYDCGGEFFDEETALMAAICHDQVEVARILLENGADPNFGNFNDKDYPLMVACRKGNRELTELLIDFGAETSLTDDKKKTPLMWACAEGRKEVAECLIDRGDDVNYYTGTTALIVACSRGHKDTVEMLLERGAEFDVVSKKGLTPLLAALRNGHEDVAMMLLERGASFERNPALDRRKLRAKRLIDSEKSLTRDEGFQNQTPIILASFWGFGRVVSFMLDKGVDVDEWDISGKTALMVASCEGKLDIVSLLIEKRPDINAKDADGLSALMWAAAWGRDEVALMLLDAGANINQKDRLGQTASDWAVKGNHQSVLNILRARGAGQQKESAYDLDVIIMQSYPYPIAYSYRLVDNFYQPLEIYRAMLRAGENIMAFLASVTVAVARNRNEDWLKQNVTNNWPGGMSPGDWIELILDSLNLLENTQDDPLSRDLYLLWRQKKGKKETGFAKTLREIAEIKNDFKHDRTPISPSLGERSKLRGKLREAMDGLGVFLSYPIRSVLEMDVDSKTSEMIFKTLRLSGDHPVLPTEEIRFIRPLRRNTLHIQDGENNWISLDPFLTFQECPECGHRETYFIDKWFEKKGLAQLKSFECGHTFNSDEIGETLNGLMGS